MAPSQVRYWCSLTMHGCWFSAVMLGFGHAKSSIVRARHTSVKLGQVLALALYSEVRYGFLFSEAKLSRFKLWEPQVLYSIVVRSIAKAPSNLEGAFLFDNCWDRCYSVVNNY